MDTAEANTNINEGSQLLFIVKNPVTFETLHIPDISNPIPNIKPIKSVKVNSMTRGVDYLFYITIIIK